MTEALYDLHGPVFAEARRGEPTRGAVAIFGACYDGTTSFRPGARFGPDALRAASLGLETYSPAQDADITELHLYDMGNLELTTGAPGPVVDAITWATRELLALGTRPLLLGGEHSVSIGAIAAHAELYAELTLVQIDAHADLRDAYAGERLNHACVMRRALDVLPSARVHQVGIRSGTRDEFQELRGSGRLVSPDAPAELAERLSQTDGPIYLTLDLDAFDPACFPGTGTPEPGGISWPTFAALLATIPSERLVAADVVELAPHLDPTGCSTVLAAKAVREIALKLGVSP